MLLVENDIVWNGPNKNKKKKLVKVYQLKIGLNCARIWGCCVYVVWGGDMKNCRGISKRIIEKLGNYAHIVFLIFN